MCHVVFELFRALPPQLPILNASGTEDENRDANAEREVRETTLFVREIPRSDNEDRCVSPRCNLSLFFFSDGESDTFPDPVANAKIHRDQNLLLFNRNCDPISAAYLQINRQTGFPMARGNVKHDY